MLQILHYKSIISFGVNQYDTILSTKDICHTQFKINKLIIDIKISQSTEGNRWCNVTLTPLLVINPNAQNINEADEQNFQIIVPCAHISQIAKFMGPTWGPPGSCRPQMGPMLAPWTLLSGMFVDAVIDVIQMSWACDTTRHNITRYCNQRPVTKAEITSPHWSRGKRGSFHIHFLQWQLYFYSNFTEMC